MLFLPYALRVLHLCNSMNIVATYLLHVIPRGIDETKASPQKVSIFIQNQMPNFQHFPEKSGSHQFPWLKGFSNSHTLHLWTCLQMLLQKPPGVIVQVSAKKKSPSQKTKNTLTFTPQKSTHKSQANKIQITKFQTKQNKTNPNKRSIKTTTSQNKKKHNPIVWGCSEVPRPAWCRITKAHCLSCNFSLQSIDLWTRETRRPKTKALVYNEKTWRMVVAKVRWKW